MHAAESRIYVKLWFQGAMKQIEGLMYSSVKLPMDWSTRCLRCFIFSWTATLYAANILINQAALVMGTANSHRVENTSSFLLNVGTYVHMYT